MQKETLSTPSAARTPQPDAPCRPTLRNRRREISRARTHVRDRSITLDELLDLYRGRSEHLELADGAPVEKERVQYDREKLDLLLVALRHLYVQRKGLGQVLYAPVATRINASGGRWPDIRLVRPENLAIVRQRGVFGLPDLTIAIRSPDDRRRSFWRWKRTTEPPACRRLRSSTRRGGRSDICARTAKPARTPSWRKAR